ncbi:MULTISPECIES: response regulator transcription factor [Citrobacter]|uniref:response regulator transcription factor n=1 Tax=Citrobacter TaxID=544 RepID=UPI00397C0A29
MKQIFFMSPCRYTGYGFTRLMESIPGHAVRVIPVSDHYQVLQYMSQESDSLRRPSAVVVDLTSHERSVLALALWFLWNLSVLYSEGRISRRVPCVLLGNRKTLENTAYPYAWVTPSQSVRGLQNFFLKVLSMPGPWMRGMYGFKHLSDKEQRVINACLKGMSVRDIAERMEITYRNVCAARQSAFRKIGLRNRNEYALLMGRIFL